MFIFKTNTPTFFDYSEQKLFENYLLIKDKEYFVVLNNSNNIVGSGGYSYDNTTKTIDLTWGMIDFNFHNKGFGTALLNYRILQIELNFPKRDIRLNTTQKTFKFYEKFGFKIEKFTKDYYTEGLDRYDMLRKIAIK
ncbi:MAG: hypothetical protein CMP49_05415 [Flavobacteriales bacterium]|nr:hypothetical protein [Flavobacteriales bacterium]|tara:strand:+ start:52831 stop:53241 length:411 start_codon:yes stop_codon:yes gene_type:complete